MTEAKPLTGLKVVDLSQGIAGPYAGMLLAQYGADVVKVEPLEGDWSRVLGKRYGDHTAYSLAGNRGKKSIALDLKSERGKEVVHRLVADADVFIEGFRPGVIERLGFGYDVVGKANPRIVYMSISGFGQSGPMRERPATDGVLQAFSGIMSVNKGAVDGLPHRVGVIVIDMATALYNFQALAMALLARERDGKGRYIDNSLMQSGVAFQTISMIQRHLEGPERMSPAMPIGTYETSDGWLNVGVLRDRDFPKFCEAMGLPELGRDPRLETLAGRLEHEEELQATVRQAFAAKSCAEWSRRLQEVHILHEKVNDYAEFLDNPHVAESGVVAWIDQPGVGRIPVPNVAGIEAMATENPLAIAPGLGEHSVEILNRLGFSAEDIAAMAAEAVTNGESAAA